MKVKLIEGQTLPRWSVALCLSAAECTRMDYRGIGLGEVVNVENDFALWLVKQGYCDHVREESE